MTFTGHRRCQKLDRIRRLESLALRAASKPEARRVESECDTYGKSKSGEPIQNRLLKISQASTFTGNRIGEAGSLVGFTLQAGSSRKNRQAQITSDR